eukprot:CAMPEP_0172866802 /NCGR_PEP_ID=MMETSP1075-20121228/82195_1 /TAXON_ID=2916 /ORGANISM="Ceratium fusus, Strain PA161109" /LENGTH=629 /DNA_ID=CAMNT_0013716011 /DNA_START=110 /DNA_END=1996 /DNA_ORIENTATION=-
MQSTPWFTLQRAPGVFTTLVAVAAHLKDGISCPRSEEVDWIINARLPFFMAFGLFMAQFTVSLILFSILRGMKELGDMWGVRFLRALQLHQAMSLIGAGLYFQKYMFRSLYVVEAGETGLYLISRHIHWLLSTPTQWFVFGLTCSKATPEELRALYEATINMQIHGILMLTRNRRLSWFCMLSSCGFFLEMFWRAFSLPLLPDMAKVGGRIRWVNFFVWVFFPIASLLRWADSIDAWSEQVLIFTSLDVIAKAITFTGILSARVVLWLAHIEGIVQVVVSSHDFLVAVDEVWQLVESPTSPLISRIFGGANSGDWKEPTLCDLCINEEHRNRLESAARIADSSQLSQPSPKVCVALRSAPTGRGEVEFHVECLVSKCLHGRRVVGIAVVGQSAPPALTPSSKPFLGFSCSIPPEIQESKWDQERIHWDQESADSGSLKSLGAMDVQMTLALHNCSYTLGFDEQMRRLLSQLFAQSEVACGLFVWASDESTMDPTVLVCSSKLVEFRYEKVPTPLHNFLSAATLANVLGSSEDQEIALHTWRHATLVQGAPAVLSWLPLNRLSPLARTSNVKLSIFVIENEKPNIHGSSGIPGYSCWRLTAEGDLAHRNPTTGSFQGYVGPRPCPLLVPL